MMDGVMLRQWMKGNEPAAQFVEAYGEAVQALDNLCDETDLSLSVKSNLVTTVMERFITGMFCNAFFQQYSVPLSTVMLQGLFEWDHSNELHQSDKTTMQTFGYVRREASDGLVVMCAYLVGGRAWAQQISRLMVVHFHSSQESLEEWVEEIK